MESQSANAISGNICTSHDILDGFQYRLGLRSKKENIYFSRSALEFSPGQKKNMTHNDFLPLSDISDEPRKTEKAKEGEQLGQPQDPGDFRSLVIVFCEKSIGIGIGQPQDPFR